jgi:NAD(P)-dependent dehydrogenase (short-subunit alcohol dehydrogenase family)
MQRVLITGCSSGIGLSAALLVAAHGVGVYATVRRHEDAAPFAGVAGVDVLVCDVTDDAAVARLRDAIVERGDGLWGLVNNAGIAHVGNLTDTSVDEMRRVFDVNVFGAHRVTLAVVDLIVASRGRIVNVSSISGVLSPVRLGPYSMTKHALEAYTDALAAQLAPAGVHVAVIEPGNYRSAILSNAVRHFPEATDRAGIDPREDLSRSEYLPPDEAAEACRSALFDPQPLRRYMVVPNADEGRRTLAKAAEELVELNAYSAYALAPAELHALVDEAAALAAGASVPA